MIGFPVDYRYGWDVRNKAHQALLRQYRKEVGIAVSSFAPTCTPWSPANTRSNPDTLAAEREYQAPILDWMVEDIKQIRLSRDDALVENPHFSQLWKTEQAAEWFRQGMRWQRTDQCMLGAIHPDSKMPVKKMTSWNSTFRLRATAIRCETALLDGPIPVLTSPRH